jgi:hypothetical protein
MTATNPLSDPTQPPPNPSAPVLPEEPDVYLRSGAAVRSPDLVDGLGEPPD